jgi:hypothetical protein
MPNDERGNGSGLPKELEWQIDTPFMDRFVAMGAVKLLAVYAVLSAIILLVIPQVYMLLTLSLVFAFLIILVIFGSHKQLQFRLDSRSVEFTTSARIGGANKVIAYLTLILGIANDRPGAVVVGVTGVSQPSRSSRGWSVEWKDVREVTFYPRERVVMLKEKRFTSGLGGGLTSLRIYCTPENYETVAAMSLAHTGKKKTVPK